MYRPSGDPRGPCCDEHREYYRHDRAKNLRPTEKYRTRHNALASFPDASAANRALTLTARKSAIGQVLVMQKFDMLCARDQRGPKRAIDVAVDSRGALTARRKKQPRSVYHACRILIFAHSPHRGELDMAVTLNAAEKLAEGNLGENH